jgi:two-component system response regulator (stage 0 sporulation protein F)
MPRILIIDDEPLVRTALRRILERHGHTVMEAPDGRAGLALWRQTPGDLVLTDIFMPDTDGIEVIVQFSRLWPGTKIIAMTGGAKTIDFMFTVAPAAFQLGARRLLMKPFTIQTLLAAISAALSPKEGTSGEASRTETPVSLKGVLR